MHPSPATHSNLVLLALLVFHVLAALAAPGRASAHPTLSEGDVAVVAIGTSPSHGPRTFAFVTLADLHVGESIAFTDRGWLAAGGFRAGEGELLWDVERPLPAGAVVELSGEVSTFVLEEGADQIFAVAGGIAADGSPTDTVLFGFELGGPWQADATSSTTSALPPSLAGAEVALGPWASCAYAGSTTGTKAQLLAAITDPARWTCSDSTRPAPPSSFTVLGDRGDPCAADADCAEGFCAHGVCCDTACRRDEAGHCSRCNFGPGDPRTGTCGPAPATLLCRLAGGPCDPMDHCDGTSTECPANVLLGPETVCHPSRGGCDPAEVCSGSAPGCPADRLAPAGAVCRPSRGGCDPEERCEGAAACPTDVVAPDETPCDDGLACTTASACRAGLCAGPVPVECDDGDRCTADSCSDSGGCMHVAVEGCCAVDADCSDGDPCTLDGCGPEGWCVAAPSDVCVDAGGPGDASGDAGTAPPASEGGCAATAPRDASAASLLALGCLAIALRRRRCRRRRRRRRR